MLLVVDEQRRAELLRQLEKIDAADVKMSLLVDLGRAGEKVTLQGCRREVVVHRHGDAGYGSVRGGPTW